MTGSGDLFKRISCRKVNDIQRRVSRDFGELHGAMCRLTLEFWWTGETVKHRIGVTLRNCLRAKHINRNAILGMHHRHHPKISRDLHRSENLSII